MKKKAKKDHTQTVTLNYRCPRYKTGYKAGYKDHPPRLQAVQPIAARYTLGTQVTAQGTSWLQAALYLGAVV
jgi:hypothetical protein